MNKLKWIGDVEKERPGDFDGKKVSAEKAKRELDWEPKIDFKEGMRRYSEWYMKNVL